MWDDVVELKIVLGKEGLFGLRNKDRIPLGGLQQLRNADLTDHTLRPEGGAATFGVPLSGVPAIRAAIDYWPDTSTQRIVAMASDGTLQKDDSLGAVWTAVTGALGALTVAGAVPSFSTGGREDATKSNALFYADGINPERVMRGDGTFAALSAPAPEWTGVNRPRGFAINQGYNWAFGCPTLPHHLVRSLDTNHENFTSTRFAVPIFGGDKPGLYVSCALNFKGFLVVWKFPAGVYAYDTRDADPANWYAVRIGSGGAPGPGCAVVAENDVLWVDPAGGMHLLSATQEAAGLRAEDIAYRKLGRFIPNQISRTNLSRAQLVYDSDRQEAVLACSAQGTTALNRRLTLDLGNKAEVGERWRISDRDVNEALFLRRESDNVEHLYMGDDAGQFWKLNQATRSKAGAGYTFEYWTADTDFAAMAQKLTGKKNSGAYLQLIYDPHSTGTHTVRIWRDGSQRQSLDFSLSGGPNALPVTLPFVLGAETMLATGKRRLLGAARRWSLQGISSVAGFDFGITGFIIGLVPGRE